MLLCQGTHCLTPVNTGVKRDNVLWPHSQQNGCEKRSQKSASLLLRRCEKRLISRCPNCPKLHWKIMPSNNHWRSQWLSSKSARKKYMAATQSAVPTVPKISHRSSDTMWKFQVLSVCLLGLSLTKQSSKFSLSCFSFLLFYNSQQSCFFWADCYGYIFDLGALACRFCHRKLVHATQINITHLIHRLTADNEQI